MNGVKRLLENGILSIIVTFAFAAFNLVLGIIKSYAFGLSIAVYYFLLSALKTYLYIIAKTGTEDKRHFVTASASVFALNVALIAPITLMVFWKRTFSLGMIPAIAVAAYSTFKIASAIVHYKGTRHSTDKAEIIKQSVNLIDAVTSLLLLQNTLLLAQNEELPDDMRILTICTSGVAYAATIAVSVISLIRTLKTPPTAS